MKKNTQDSVHNEPHLHNAHFQSDPSDKRPANTNKPSQASAAYDSVWNEPGHNQQSEIRPYATWLLTKRQNTPASITWLVSLGLALAAGPLAILSAFWGSGQTLFSILALTVFGPIIEEMGKIMAILITVERWPFLIRYRTQIFFFALCSGLAFASIENLIYLNFYIDNPSQSIIQWRWTVCVALHTTCTFIAASGVARIWSETWRTLSPPRTETGAPLWIAAIVIHGAYNAFAIAFETILKPF